MIARQITTAVALFAFWPWSRDPLAAQMPWGAATVRMMVGWPAAVMTANPYLGEAYLGNLT